MNLADYDEVIMNLIMFLFYLLFSGCGTDCQLRILEVYLITYQNCRKPKYIMLSYTVSPFMKVFRTILLRFFLFNFFVQLVMNNKN